MTRECYRRLAQHLDRLPGGFDPSETGAELRLLEKLFTPQQADLAVHLTLDREIAQVIADRAALPLDEAEQLLDEMALQGLILSYQTADGPTCYQAAPFIVGIYEFQVNNLTPEIRSALHDYWGTSKPRPPVQTIRQMRTIPIGQSIEPHLETLPYEHVGKVIENHDRFAVAPCICRRHAKLEDKGCDAPEETCLMFGDMADYYVRTGRGRRIDRAEVKEILIRADAANLVLQPTNSQDVAAICCCCGCCCGVLGGLKHHPKPAEAVVNAFAAQIDVDLCQGCWICLERCQMGALSEDGDRVALDADRCIGCGLCVSTCPSGALTLVRKPESKQKSVPTTLDNTWHTIAKQRREVLG